MFYRVFARSEKLPTAATIADRLAELKPPVRVHARGDDTGWFALELHTSGPGAAVLIERFHAADDDLRSDLQSWAAWLETQDHEPQHERLMEQTIQTRQLFIIRRPNDHADEIALERLCKGACMALADLADGFWQADNEGFFDADGTPALTEY